MQTSSKHNQVFLKSNQGFLLPVAIFLLVILAGLGTYALNIQSVQQASSTADIQSIRAYHLARAGAELSAYYIMQTSPDTTTIPTTCPGGASTSMVIDGFTITSTCSPVYVPYYEQGSDREIGIYTITSNASYGTANTNNYVEREIQIDLSKCRATDAATAYQCS